MAPQYSSRKIQPKTSRKHNMEPWMKVITCLFVCPFLLASSQSHQAAANIYSNVEHHFDCGQDPSLVYRVVHVGQYANVLFLECVSACGHTDGCGLALHETSTGACYLVHRIYDCVRNTTDTNQLVGQFFICWQTINLKFF